MMKTIVTHINLAATLLFALIFSGCALINPTIPYTPDSKRISDKSIFVSGSRFEAETVEGAITLPEAIKIALSNNPGVAMASHDTDAAKSQHDIAIGSVLPEINLVGSGSYFRDDRLIQPRRPGTAEVLDFTDQLVSGDVILRLPLFAGGRFINEIRATKLLQTAAEHRMTRTKDELVYNVSSLFYRIKAQGHVIAALHFSKHTLEEHLKRVNELVRAQKAATVDRLRTEVRLSDLEQRLVREQNVMAIQSRVLINLMGIREEPSAPISFVGSLTTNTLVLPDIESSLHKALDQRSDYLAASAALEAQAKRVDIARAGHSPTLFLEGSYGVRSDASDAMESNVNNEVGSVAIGISIPIYRGGRTLANVRKERAILAVAQEKLRNLEYQVHLEVETAILNMASSGERIKATEKSIQQARESMRIEREKYDYAKGSITDVLDAQSALLDSEMNYYQALADFSTAVAQYRLAVGEAI